MSNVLCIDLDGTICEFKYPGMGKLNSGVKEAFKEMKEMGFDIWIYTSRTALELNPHPIDRKVEVENIENFLKENDIPYDRVLNVDKPIAFAYIDDKGIGYRGDWKEVIKELKRMRNE